MGSLESELIDLGFVQICKVFGTPLTTDANNGVVIVYGNAVNEGLGLAWIRNQRSFYERSLTKFKLKQGAYVPPFERRRGKDENPIPLTRT